MSSRAGRVAVVVAGLLMVLGLVAMHSMLTPSHGASDDAAMASMSMSTEQPAHHGDPDSGTGCGPVALMCMALIVGFVLLVLGARFLGRVLWRRPRPPRHVHPPTFQLPVDPLTPLQRTTVLRC